MRLGGQGGRDKPDILSFNFTLYCLLSISLERELVDKVAVFLFIALLLISVCLLVNGIGFGAGFVTHPSQSPYGIIKKNKIMRQIFRF